MRGPCVGGIPGNQVLTSTKRSVMVVVKSNHCNPVVRKVVGNVPLYRFITMFKLEKNPNALSLDPSNSSGMMPFHNG